MDEDRQMICTKEAGCILEEGHKGYHRFIKENRWCLFSGGKDSITMTHYVMSQGLADGVLFVDTGINLPETVQFVKDVCTKYGWRLEISTTTYTYEDLVMKFGFPGPRWHNYFFTYLKENAIRKFVRKVDGKEVILYSGVRTSESVQRFKNARETKVGRRIYKVPILDWTTEQVWKYIHDNGLPINPVYQTLHISGDCLCGSFADQTEVDLLLTFYPDLAKRIGDLEKRRAALTDVRCKYGGTKGAMGVEESSKNLQERMTCSECQDK